MFYFVILCVMFKKYIADILWYIWIWFIAGAVSHGFFSWIRSIVMATLWIILFVIHQYLTEWSIKNYVSVIVFGLLYSISIGMVSWWLQHFLDSPTRSLWIIPTWFFLSYLLYCHHMKSTTRHKNLNIALIGAIVLWWIVFAAYRFVPTTWYSGMDWHHDNEDWWKQAMNCMQGEWGCKQKCGQWDMNCMMQQSQDQNGMMGMMHHENVTSEEQFIRDMIPHHQEAVDTSKEIVARSTNQELKNLAQDIIDAQTKEIAMMQWWLQEWYPNSTWTATYKNMMPNLTIVSGASLDILYLQGMMMHHQWAISMAQSVLWLNPRADVQDFANDVIEVQSSEITQMQTMLQSLTPWMKRGGMMMDHNKMWH